MNHADEELNLSTLVTVLESFPTIKRKVERLVPDPKLLGPYLSGLDTAAFDPSVFERLPPNCAGYLLCLWGDVVSDVELVVEFLPVPGREVPPAVQAVLGCAGVFQRDRTGAR